MGRKRRIPLPKAYETLARMLERLGDRYDPHKVFQDFVEMSALALSNRFDLRQYEAREQHYLTIIKRYTTLEDRLVFPNMLAELAIALDKTEEDVLGPISASLGLTNYRKGMFWTPYHVSHMMAKMLLAGNGGGDKSVTADLADGHIMTACDPCCGPGGMVLAFAQAFKEEGHNLQQLHFTAVDIAPWCAYMTYIQTSLMHIPAIVHVGNSLANTFTERWYTPAHIVGGFSRRLRQQGIDEESTAWWKSTAVPDRIDFLQANNLDIGQAATDKASRDVLNAAQAMPVEIHPPA